MDKHKKPWLPNDREKQACIGFDADELIPEIPDPLDGRYSGLIEEE